ncbi:NAD(P)-binding protein, partial [Clostridioides difficile]|nr:NAD(P)-binding protein [Clostridioides difficile]
IQIIKQSVDARKKEEIHFTYSIDVETTKEESVIHKAKSGDIGMSEIKEYYFPKPGIEQMASRPVIIGAGPAGLFCGLMLARHGYRPLLLERGESVEKRREAVDLFWNGGT